MAKARFEIDAELRDSLKKVAAMGDQFRQLTGDVKQAEKASSSFGSVFKGTFASGIAQSALSGIAGGVVSLGGAMIKGAAELENYKTQFEVMLGSAEAGNAMFAQLQKFGASTPFETGDLAAATQTMLGFGIGAGDVMGNLQMLGDVAGGNSEKLKSLTLTFSQIQSAGKLTGGDLLQMIGQGFNPLKYISEETGESMVSLKEKMEKGAISADMVTAAFKRATGEGGQFNGMMEKQAKTLDGMISTLKDTVGMMLADLGTQLLPLIKTLVDGLTRIFSDPKIMSAIRQIGELLTTLLGPILDMIIPLLQQLLPPVIMVAQAIGGVLVSAIKVLSPILQSMAGIIAQLSPVYAQLGAFVGKLLEALAPLLAVLPQLIGDMILPLLPLLTSVIDLMTALLPVIKLVATVLGFLAGVGGDFIRAVVTPIVDALKYIIDNAAAAVNAIASVFGGGPEGENAAYTTMDASKYGGPGLIRVPGGLIPAETPAAGGAPPPKPPPPKTGGGKKKTKAESKVLEADAEGAVDWDAITAENEARRKAAQDAEAARNAEDLERWKRDQLERAQAAVDAETRMRDLRIALMEDEQEQREAIYQRDLDALQEKLDRELIEEKEFALAKERLDRDKDKAEKEAQTKAAQGYLGVVSGVFKDLQAVAGEQSDVFKALAIMQATMDTYAAANAAYKSAAAIPFVGAVLGPVAAAAAVAAGLANVAKITSVKALAEGGILSRPVFVAGEAGAEVVAPLKALPGMLAETMARMRDGGGTINRRTGDSYDAAVSIGIDTFGRGSTRARIRKTARQM